MERSRPNLDTRNWRFIRVNIFLTLRHSHGSTPLQDAMLDPSLEYGLGSSYVVARHTVQTYLPRWKATICRIWPVSARV